MNKPTVLAFLQNPWSQTWAGKRWPRSSWLQALRESRSGKRLAVVERAAGIEIVWDNTTPEVGDHPDSKLAPNFRHIRRVLARHEPDSVVAFGKQAASALSAIWSGPLLVVPHPTYRVVTDRLYRAAGHLIAAGLTDRIELVQLRGRFRRVPLSPTVPRD